ncbi:MAG TPA: hypothetical protein DG753_06955, partial [Clostridium sp.]|nr:hypothetical protein [Clostridium sp.]
KKKIFFIREEKIDNLRIDFGDCINKFELDNITVVNNMLFKETFNSDKIANDFGKNQIEVKDASNGILKFETTGNDGYIIVDNINVNKSFNKDVIILEIGLVILSAIVANIYKLVKILTKYANNKIVIYIAIVLTIIIAITVDSIFKLIYLFFVSAILLLNNKLRENA